MSLKQLLCQCYLGVKKSASLIGVNWNFVNKEEINNTINTDNNAGMRIKIAPNK